jgi:CRP-like cAMP-binding protein
VSKSATPVSCSGKMIVNRPMKEERFKQLDAVITSVTHVPEAELAYLHDRLKSIRIREGDFFIQAGEIPACFGFIGRGLFRIYYLDEKGDEFTTQFFPENRFVTAYADFIAGTATVLYIQALEDSDLLTLHIDNYREILDRNVCWQIFSRKIIEAMFFKKLKRENELLAYDAETRYRLFTEEYPGLEERIRQYQIASYIGISHVSLSRIRSKQNQR